MSMLNPSYKQYPHERAAVKLAEAQHAPGVTVRMNPQTFRVEYIRPDGSRVPDYDWFLNEVLQGRL